MASKTAVLLLAHGTPETLDDIPAYLRNVTSGRPMPDSVVEEIRHRYARIGRSPLTELTFAQARLLEQEIGVPVYVGMRNWRPYIADTVRGMRAGGVTNAVAICLAPQNSRTSVGLYRRAVIAEAGSAMQVEFIEAWADHPLLAEAFAEKLAAGWLGACAVAGTRVPVVFTAHSVPCRTVQTAQVPAEGSAARTSSQTQTPDPYAVEAKRTAANVATVMAQYGFTERDWVFAFQSQGMSGGPWIGPTVEDTLRSLREAGHTTAIIHPIGFVCDHVEVLYDIDIAFREFGAQIGINVVRPASLNTSPLLIACLADLARGGLERLRAKPALSAALTPS